MFPTIPHDLVLKGLLASAQAMSIAEAMCVNLTIFDDWMNLTSATSEMKCDKSIVE